MKFSKWLNEEISYEEYLKQSEILNKKVDDLSDALQGFPKGDMGLVADTKDPKYRKAKSDYDKAFKELRDFNGKKEFKKYHKQKMMDKRAKRFNK